LKDKPMPLTLHEASIAVMIHGFHNLAGVLERARLHAEEQSIDEAQFLDARLFDDMMTMRQQVQRASDTAKRAAIRVAGVADVSMPDDEASFADLSRRIEATVAFLRAVPPEAIDGGADVSVALPTGGGNVRTLSGQAYMLEFAVPNFFFHLTTAYDLLRHKGVPVGKRHFLGWE
jgi:hypothetical protein